MAYKAVISFPCKAHEGHHITITARDDWAILLAVNEAREIAQIGMPVTLNCFKDNARMSQEDVANCVMNIQEADDAHLGN